MLEISAQAPSGWDAEYTEDAIRRFVLRERPDWIFYQEIPNHVPFAEGYELVRAQTESHCGTIVTLVRAELVEEEPVNHSVVPRCAVLSEIPRFDLTIANVHLAPMSAGAPARLRMLQQIVEATQTARLLVIGDTNTRIVEEKEIRELGFDVARPPVATWNTRENHFRKKSRKYTAYYTRYFAKGDMAVAEVKVHDTPMKVDGQSFFLSDHFAMSGSLETPAKQD